MSEFDAETAIIRYMKARKRRVSETDIARMVEARLEEHYDEDADYTPPDVPLTLFRMVESGRLNWYDPKGRDSLTEPLTYSVKRVSHAPPTG